MKRTDQPSAGAAAARGSRLWWWIVAAFAIQIAAWTAWFIIAAHHPVQEIPLVNGAGRPAGE